MDIPTLVFATNNSHKLEEVRAIVGKKFNILSLSDIGCNDDIPETAPDFEGNALLKARWIKEKYGYDCFADDTGLLVDALDGAPGVYSARYAGEPSDSEANIAKLLAELEGIENRTARFRTVVCLLQGDSCNYFTGEVEGKIAHSRHGNGGFGYDPVFVADETGLCFAEMSAEDKNAISHRGRAVRKLGDYLAGISHRYKS